MTLLTSAFVIVGFVALGAPDDRSTKRIAVEWSGGRPQGQISITDASLSSLSVARGRGTAAGDRFSATEDGPFRLEIQLKGSGAIYGPGGAIVTVSTARHPFSFFLRDVRSEQPIYIPQYRMVVTDAADARPYERIVAAIRARGLQSKLERIESEPEESFENAAANTRSLSCQTWLGLSRDIRLFGFSERLDWIQPRFQRRDVELPETDHKPCRYNFLIGRGWGPLDNITRRLEQGVFPILRGTLVDDHISYGVIAFVDLESRPVTAQNLRGTHFLVADGQAGAVMTKEQRTQYESLLPGEMNQPEELVLFMRISAVNTARVPRYAFFRNPSPSRAATYRYDTASGFATYASGRVFAVSKLNGKPLAVEEIAIQLGPGETAELDIYLPHRPISPERALKLREISLDERLAGCRRFWQAKLAAAAQVHVPEQRISEMIRAGLLHLDLITYGREPEGTLTPTVGVYSAIGSESAPIIQAMDSMGWHDVASRALMYFLDKQQEDGLIHNYRGYTLETGAVLWSLGEHYRYTRDEPWVRQIAPKLIKSCGYLRRWRQRNVREALRGRGYGMLEGKTADPEDPFHSFMLNGYAYLGLSRVAEMLSNVDPAQSREWQKEADELKREIRSAFFEVMGKSPVIPLANGTWCPTVPPWVEYRGPLVLSADGGNWATHGARVTRDSLLGPIYLIFQEVIDPLEPAAGFLLDFHNDLMTTHNVAFSQPYYSRHPIAHLRRGEVKPFLKAYYNTVASLADRQTYTFWEHFFGGSPHKTHEEAWFLMDTRWMLYMERGAGIDLLPGIPRAYLESGKRIELKNVATYFGPLSLRVASRLEEGRIVASVECPERKPKYVEIRLPHPLGRKAVWVAGGSYDPATERVRVEPFDGRAEVTLGFEPRQPPSRNTKSR